MQHAAALVTTSASRSISSSALAPILGGASSRAACLCAAAGALDGAAGGQQQRGASSSASSSDAQEAQEQAAGSAGQQPQQHGGANVSASSSGGRPSAAAPSNASQQQQRGLHVSAVCAHSSAQPVYAAETDEDTAVVAGQRPHHRQAHAQAASWQGIAQQLRASQLTDSSSSSSSSGQRPSQQRPSQPSQHTSVAAETRTQDVAGLPGEQQQPRQAEDTRSRLQALATGGTASAWQPRRLSGRIAASSAAGSRSAAAPSFTMKLRGAPRSSSSSQPAGLHASAAAAAAAPAMMGVAAALHAELSLTQQRVARACRGPGQQQLQLRPHLISVAAATAAEHTALAETVAAARVYMPAAADGARVAEMQQQQQQVGSSTPRLQGLWSSWQQQQQPATGASAPSAEGAALGTTELEAWLPQLGSGAAPAAPAAPAGDAQAARIDSTQEAAADAAPAVASKPHVLPQQQLVSLLTELKAATPAKQQPHQTHRQRRQQEQQRQDGPAVLQSLLAALEARLASTAQAPAAGDAAAAVAATNSSGGAAGSHGPAADTAREILRERIVQLQEYLQHSQPRHPRGSEAPQPSALADWSSFIEHSRGDSEQQVMQLLQQPEQQLLSLQQYLQQSQQQQQQQQQAGGSEQHQHAALLASLGDILSVLPPAPRSSHVASSSSRGGPRAAASQGAASGALEAVVPQDLQQQQLAAVAAEQAAGQQQEQAVDQQAQSLQAIAEQLRQQHRAARAATRAGSRAASRQQLDSLNAVLQTLQPDAGAAASSSSSGAAAAAAGTDGIEVQQQQQPSVHVSLQQGRSLQERMQDLLQHWRPPAGASEQDRQAAVGSLAAVLQMLPTGPAGSSISNVRAWERQQSLQDKLQQLSQQQQQPRPAAAPVASHMQDAGAELGDVLKARQAAAAAVDGAAAGPPAPTQQQVAGAAAGLKGLLDSLQVPQPSEGFSIDSIIAGRWQADTAADNSTSTSSSSAFAALTVDRWTPQQQQQPAAPDASAAQAQQPRQQQQQQQMQWQQQRQTQWQQQAAAPVEAKLATATQARMAQLLSDIVPDDGGTRSSRRSRSSWQEHEDADEPAGTTAAMREAQRRKQKQRDRAAGAAAAAERKAENKAKKQTARVAAGGAVASVWASRAAQLGSVQPAAASAAALDGSEADSDANSDSEQLFESAAAAAAMQEVQMPPGCTFAQLASLLGVPLSRLEGVFQDQLGEDIKSEEDLVAPESAELVALEFGRVLLRPPQDAAAAQPRPPVVTVMGHVDHGKTSLLDALRSSNVTAGEAGGITQHIGAFEVIMPGSGAMLTFLDTPGHAAFGAMRARGAAATDIVVLAVAADDGVMPQTREALAHARAAHVPIVVALTKCDLPQARVEQVKVQLLSEGVELEEFGGDVQLVETAARAGLGLKELEDALLLQAEVMELRAPREVPAGGVVIEAQLSKGLGPVATVILRRGVLRAGDPLVVGTEHGRVRVLRDGRGKVLQQAGPGQAVVVSGLKGLPAAGDELVVVADEARAAKMAAARSARAQDFRLSHLTRVQAEARGQQQAAREQEYERKRKLRQRIQDLRGSGFKAHTLAALKTLQQQSMTLEEQQLKGTAAPDAAAAGSDADGAAAAAAGSDGDGDAAAAEGALPPGAPSLTLLIKGDVQGSVEAVEAAVQGAAAGRASVRCVYAGVGPITASDAHLAAATGARVVAFNLAPPAGDVDAALRGAHIEVLQHNVIYHLLDEVTSLIDAAEAGGAGGQAGLAEQVLGSALVLQVFPMIKARQEVGQVAGCRVQDGSLSAAPGVVYRVLREGQVVFEGPCSSLRQQRNSVAAVAKGGECGLALGDGTFADWQAGDVVQCVTRRTVRA